MWTLKQRRLVGVLGGLLLVLGAAAGPPLATSNGGSATRAVQISSHPTANDPNHVHHRPGSIVGLETPELIPTGTAVGLMLRTLASIAERDSPRVALYFSHVEQHGRSALSAADRQKILSAARRYVDATGGASGPVAPAQRPNAQVAATLWTELNQGLSPEARAGLLVFVEQYVKRNIKILK